MIRRQHGFTLIEVLVAFVILAFSLGVLYQAFGHGLASLDLARKRSQALMVAESALALQTVGPPRFDVVQQGDQGDFHWQAWRTPLEEERDYRLFRPYVLKVQVRWLEHGRPRVLHLETVRLARR